MQKKSPGILFYLTVIMSAFYPLAGIYLLVTNQFDVFLPGNKKIVLGSLLILYGIFRFYRLQQLNKVSSNQHTSSQE